MSREIKFRAMELDTGRLVYGYYVAEHGYYMNNGVPDLNKPVVRHYIIGDSGKHYICEETVCQFTGMKDKEGTDIYERDIVLMHTEWSGGYDSEDFGEHENKGVVSIVPSKGVMLNKCLKRDLIECEDQWSKTWPVNVRSCKSVVIGNIYENPELLKANK